MFCCWNINKNERNTDKMNNKKEYVLKQKITKKITLEETLNIFDKEFDKSVEDKDYLGGFDLMIRVKKENNDPVFKYKILKKMTVDIIEGLVYITVYKNEWEYICVYVNLEGSDELPNFKGVADVNDYFYKIPLKYFVKDKKIVHKILEDFFNDGDTSEMEKKLEINFYREMQNTIELPVDIVSYLEKIKNHKRVDELEIIERFENSEVTLKNKTDKLKNFNISIRNKKVIFNVIKSKIENYIKENNIENIYFKNREEIKGQENVINFFKENLVVPC